MNEEVCLGDTGVRHYAATGVQDSLCVPCRQAVADLEARNPVRERAWELFAHLNDDGSITDFYESTVAVGMCGSGQIALVRLHLAADGPYWGWYHTFHPYNRTARGRVSMIWNHEQAVRMCFAYGPETETKAGRGHIVRLNAQVVRPAYAREGIKGYEP